MAQGIRALAALGEDLGLVPMVAHNTCNSRSRGSSALLWSPWALYTCSTKINAAGASIHEINKSKGALINFF